MGQIRLQFKMGWDQGWDRNVREIVRSNVLAIPVAYLRC